MGREQKQKTVKPGRVLRDSQGPESPIVQEDEFQEYSAVAVSVHNYIARVRDRSKR